MIPRFAQRFLRPVGRAFSSFLRQSMVPAPVGRSISERVQNMNISPALLRSLDNKRDLLSLEEADRLSMFADSDMFHRFVSQLDQDSAEINAAYHPLLESGRATRAQLDRALETKQRILIEQYRPLIETEVRRLTILKALKEIGHSSAEAQELLERRPEAELLKLLESRGYSLVEVSPSSAEGRVSEEKLQLLQSELKSFSKELEASQLEREARRSHASPASVFQNSIFQMDPNHLATMGEKEVNSLLEKSGDLLDYLYSGGIDEKGLEYIQSEKFKQFAEKFDKQSMDDIVKEPELQRIFSSLHQPKPSAATSETPSATTSQSESEKDSSKITSKDIDRVVERVTARLREEKEVLSGLPKDQFTLERIESSLKSLADRTEKAKRVDPSLGILDSDPFYKQMKESLDESVEQFKRLSEEREEELQKGFQKLEEHERDLNSEAKGRGKRKKNPKSPF